MKTKTDNAISEHFRSIWMVMVGIPAEDLTLLSLNSFHEYQDHALGYELVYWYSVNMFDFLSKDTLFQSYPGTSHPSRGSS
jgi:hypothetical protein